MEEKKIESELPQKVAFEGFDGRSFIPFASGVVVEFCNRKYEMNITAKNIFVVWFCKTLKNCKCMLANDVPEDRRLFEATYDGEKKKVYLDVYEKQFNILVDPESKPEPRMEVIAEVAGLKSDCVFYDPAIGTCPDYSTFRYPDCEGCSTYRSKHAICRAQQ